MARKVIPGLKLFIALVVVVALIFGVTKLIEWIKNKNKSASARKNSTRNSKGAAARRSGASSVSTPSCRSGGACGNDVYYNGETSNSALQPDATLTQQVLQTATQTGQQGTMSAKNLTLIQTGLSSGGGYNFSDELVNKALESQNLNMILQEAMLQNPERTKLILEASSQRADSTGISRTSRLSPADMKKLVSVETGLDVTSLGGKDVGLAGRPQDFAALAQAVGSENMKYYRDSNEKYANLIEETFVSTADQAQVAALTAIINNENDPIIKEKLLIGLRGLKTAMFSSVQKAREALVNVPDLGFQYQKPARGDVGTLGSRFGAQGTSGGPGGDLMGVFFADDVIPTVNKERLAVCGGATTQAYAYAMGDKAVLDTA